MPEYVIVFFDPETVDTGLTYGDDLDPVMARVSSINPIFHKPTIQDGMLSTYPLCAGTLAEQFGMFPGKAAILVDRNLAGSWTLSAHRECFGITDPNLGDDYHPNPPAVELVRNRWGEIDRVTVDGMKVIPAMVSDDNARKKPKHKKEKQ